MRTESLGGAQNIGPQRGNDGIPYNLAQRRALLSLGFVCIIRSKKRESLVGGSDPALVGPQGNDGILYSVRYHYPLIGA